MTDPGPSRRELLRLGLLAGSASVLGACGLSRNPRARAVLAGVSRFNDWVGENVLQSGHRLAPTYPHSKRTPERLFPAYSIAHPLPELPDPAAWGLEVGGLVEKPTRFTLEMLQALPRVTYTVKHHCVEGWSAIATWTGVPVSTVVGLVDPKPQAKFLRFDTFDKNYFNGWDFESALHPQTILAYAFNNRPLTPAHGAPLRLYSPIKLGYKLTKYLTALTFTAQQPGGYWEDMGYPWLGGI